MRPQFVALALCAVALAPLVHADVPYPMAVLVTQAPDDPTTLVTWSASPGAVSYIVLRGPSLDELTPVQMGTETFYLDVNGSGMVYEVNLVTSQGDSQSGPSSGGDCVSADSQAHVTVTANDCVHTRS